MVCFVEFAIRLGHLSAQSVTQCVRLVQLEKMLPHLEFRRVSGISAARSANIARFGDSTRSLSLTDAFHQRNPLKTRTMAPNIIFFDIDGTLLLTGGAGQTALEKALTDEFQTNFPFEGVLTAGRTDRGITDEIFARYDFENTPDTRNRFRNAYLQRLPETLQESPGVLLPQVRELIEELASIDNIVLSLLTGNYEEAAWIKLRHYQLDGFFSFGGFGDHHAARDDVARNALAAAVDHLGHHVDGAQTMVIGDTPADITCARAIGAKAVGVATGSFESHQLETHEPDLLFHDFSDTRLVVEKLVGVFG